MSDLLDDPAFWLPTEILDGDVLPGMDLCANTKSKAQKNGGFGFGLGFDFEACRAMFPFEFPYAGYGAFGVSSDLSSPVESVGGSSETESDEEEYLAGLTRQMARSTLEDGFKNSDSVFVSENPKGRVLLSGSPQSTLCAVGSGCGCGQGSSGGSPNAQSPPATWDLLHAAAGEVAKMRMNQSRGPLGPPTKPSPVSVPLNTNLNNPDVSYYLQQQSLSHKHLQATRFQRLRQQQMMEEQSSGVWGAQSRYQQQQAQAHAQTQQMLQSRVRNDALNALNTRPLGLSQGPWPSLQQAQQQQHQKNGLRGVFLRNQDPVARKECTGTGVFIPLQMGHQSETRKKQQGCSRAFLPAKVVQALKLNVDEMQPQLQPRSNGRQIPDYELALRLRSHNAAISQQKRNLRPQPQGTMNNEIRLPQEWTY